MSMTGETPALDPLRERIQRWRELEVIMARLRRDALRTVDTAAAVEALDQAYRVARRLGATRTTGLVEQQRWFYQVGR